MKPITWTVEGRSGSYTVTLDNGVWLCQCPDHEFRGHQCRHIRAVSMLQRLALLDRESVDLLETLAKQSQQDDPFQRTGYQLEPKPMSAKEKLDNVFGE